MLQKLSAQIQECHLRAHEAKRRADATEDEMRKADFLDIERRWLTLARSYEFGERLTDFTARDSDSRRRLDGRLASSIRPVDAPQIVQKDNVDALFEHMWLASKNLLANVRAIMNLSESDSPQGLKDAIEGRIEALANVHALFVQSSWTGAELGVLVRQELSPYTLARNIRTEIGGPAVMLKPDLAQPIALLLNELATNSAKYGALSVRGGHLRVLWSRASHGDVALRWTEAGGPPVIPPTRKGFGSNMIDVLLGDHLGADVQLDWRAEGLVCEITLPM
jgi:two-component sensor histidine kinase